MGKTVKLNNVRLSFPSIFKKASFNGVEGKYEATVLFPKTDVDTYNKVMEAIEQCKIENKNTKVSGDKLFIQDGDLKDYDGYEGMWAVKASNNKRFTIINKDKTPITEEDDIIYAGCYVNIIIEPWSQSNQYGKRINANLLGIQFVKDGEAFGDGNKDVTDEFDAFDDEDDL